MLRPHAACDHRRRHCTIACAKTIVLRSGRRSAPESVAHLVAHGRGCHGFRSRRPVAGPLSAAAIGRPCEVTSRYATVVEIMLNYIEIVNKCYSYRPWCSTISAVPIGL